MSSQPFPFDEPPHEAASSAPESYGESGKLRVGADEYADNLRWLAACGLKVSAVKVSGIAAYEIAYYTPQ